METLQTLSARQSVRDYQARAVARETLEKVLAFANKAANAGPFQVTVVQDAALLREINDATHVAMRDSGNGFLA
jgi:nitroreductase